MDIVILCFSIWKMLYKGIILEWKEIFSRNRVMQAFSRYTGFQKLLAFFFPIFVFIPCYALTSWFAETAPPQVLRCLRVFMLWLPLLTWSYLGVSLQTHWRQETRNFVANIIFLFLTLSAIILCFLV